MEAPPSASAAGPYQPLNPDLDEIRVVILARGAFDEPVQCRLQHVSLSADEASAAYETVSYCWGDATRKASVQVNGLDVEVPLSAEAGLRYFRREDQDRTLWIDSICINQADHEERNRQVALMSKVYSCGACNLVWLGPGDDDGSGEALLRSLSQVKERIATIDTWTQQDLSLAERYRDPSAPLPSSVLEPIARFLLNPYFERMWVVQEAVLARRNHCQLGYCQPSFVDVLNASEYIWMNNTTVDPSLLLQVYPSLTRITSMYFFMDLRHGLFRPTRGQGPPKLTLNVLMTAAREYRVTEPRDVVYGVLGLYGSLCLGSTRPSSLPSTLTPQYASPLSAVFANTARQAILDTGWLNTFRLISHRPAEPNPPDWPSWTPRYDRRETLADAAQLANIEYYQAAADTSAQLLDSPAQTPATLALKGIPVASVPNDSISKLSMVLVQASQCHDFLEDVKQILDPGASKSPAEVFDTAAGRTLIAGVDFNAWPATDDDFAAVHAFVTSIQEGADAHGLIAESMKGYRGIEDAARQQAVRYAAAFWKTCRQRRFFTLSSGAIGVGPETMQVGDVLAVLYGGDTPFVLHPRGAEYSLVGRCYVDGLMNGEAVPKHRESGAEDAVFILR